MFSRIRLVRSVVSAVSFCLFVQGSEVYAENVDAVRLLEFLNASRLGETDDLTGDGQTNYQDLFAFGLFWFQSGSFLTPSPTPTPMETESPTPEPSPTPSESPILPPNVNPPQSPTNANSVQLTGSAFPGTIVEISNGISVFTEPVGFSGDFSIAIPLPLNRINRLFATTVATDGRRSSSIPIEIIQDGQPPELWIDFPADKSVLTNTEVTIAGRISDRLSGFMGLDVQVNGENAAVVVGIGTNGSYERGGVPLSLGENTIMVIASDALGNSATEEVTLTRVEPTGPKLLLVSGNAQMGQVNQELPEPLILRVTEPDGLTPIKNKVIDFHVIRNDGRLAAQPGIPAASAAMFFQTHTDDEGFAYAYWRMGGTAGCGNNRIEVTTLGSTSTLFFCASAEAGPATQINIGSGNNQRCEVLGIAPEPLKAWVSDSCNPIEGIPVTFKVVQGFGLVNGATEVTLNTGTTGHVAVSFMAGESEGNNVIEADFPGNQGLPATFTVFGVQRNNLLSTRMTGVVLDNAFQPIEGVRCSLVVGSETLSPVFTDEEGFFNFIDIAEGHAHLHVDGSLATAVGGKPIPIGSFPSLSYELIIIPNTENRIPMPILLPALNPNNAVPFDNTQDVELTVEGVEGLRMIVRAGSMTRADGTVPDTTNPAVLSLNQVHHDDVPMPMPDGAAPPFAWTLQPGGAIFDPPIEVHYPNMTGLPAGALAYFLSFDHDTHRFDIVASGQVSEDASTIVSDPNSGITKAGWGGNCPPYAVTGNVEPECSDEEFAPDGCGSKVKPAPFPVPQRVLIPGAFSVYEIEISPLCNTHDTCYSTCGASQSDCDVDLYRGISAACLSTIPILDVVALQRCAVVAAAYYAAVSGFGECAHEAAQKRLIECDKCPKETLPKVRRKGIDTFYKDTDSDLLPDEWEDEWGLDSSNPKDAFSDEEGDKLPNFYEFLMSTDPFNSDSDNDGIDDLEFTLAMQPPPPDHLDATWTLLLNGQSVAPDAVGVFEFRNISAPDSFGAEGPGSRPDLLSDEFFRIIGTSSSILGTRYVYSLPFRIVQRQIVEVSASSFTFSDNPPPVLQSIKMDAVSSILIPGATTQITTTGFQSDGTQLNISTVQFGTTYRVSNSGVVGVNELGVARGKKPGVAFITATNWGATAVKRITVAAEIQSTTFEGLVVDEVGGPIAGATVSIPFLGIETVADASGFFSLAAIFPAETAQLTLLVDTEDGSFNSLPIVPLLGGITDVGVLSPPIYSSTLTGCVQFENGDPAVTANVFSNLGGGTVTDASGCFSLNVPRLLQEGPLPALAVIARIVGASETYVGVQPGVLPVPGGTSDIGTIVLEIQSGPLYPSQRILAGSLPVQVTTADLNQDGHLDLATSNVNSNNISILFGNGDGTFQNQVTFAAGVKPDSITSAHLNGDEFPDLVTVHRDSTELSVFIGNGNGTFQSRIVLTAGNSPRFVTLADFNGDQLLDIAASNVSDDDVSVMLGNGNGTFQFHVRFGAGDAPQGIRAGDFNGDDQVDLVTVNTFTDDVSVLLGNGDGTFQTELRIPTGDSPQTVAIGTFNSDGNLDIATANNNSDNVSVLLGNGDGSFETAVHYMVGDYPRSIISEDCNGDQIVDLVCINSNSHDVSVLLGNGDGTFEMERRFLAGVETTSVVSGDLDEDGAVDLVTSNISSLDGNPEVIVLMGDGDGNFDSRTRSTTGSEIAALVATDLNRDGYADLAAGNTKNDRLRILIGNGDGTFQTEVGYDCGKGPTALAIADVDGDRKDDIITANRNGLDASVLLGNGDGTVQPFVPLALGVQQRSVVTADFNSDSRIDLAFGEPSSNYVPILLGNGDGSFQAPLQAFVWNAPVSIGVADFNDDGMEDLASAHQNDARISVALGNGDGTFAPRTDFATSGSSGGIRNMVIGDFNGDGKEDVATASVNNDDVSIKLGSGDGSLQGDLHFGVGDGPGWIIVGDFNLDGMDDLATANKNSDDVSILIGKGDGTFHGQQRFRVEDGPVSIASGDFNVDGRPDLVTVSDVGRKLCVLLHR